MFGNHLLKKNMSCRREDKLAPESRFRGGAGRWHRPGPGRRRARLADPHPALHAGGLRRARHRLPGPAQRQALQRCRDDLALDRPGLLEAKKTFRRLKAYRQLPILQKALQEHARKAQANASLEAGKKAA